MPNEKRKGAAASRPFSCVELKWRRAQGTRGFWPFAGKSGIRAAADRRNPGISSAPKQSSIRRFSSAVEQRFCKPKVGSSILSTGTTGLAYKIRVSCSIGFVLCAGFVLQVVSTDTKEINSLQTITNHSTQHGRNTLDSRFVPQPTSLVVPWNSPTMTEHAQCPV